MILIFKSALEENIDFLPGKNLSFTLTVDSSESATLRKHLFNILYHSDSYTDDVVVR